jgi:hypothetical protein
MVPVGNRYSLQNLSAKESITLYFVLVKPARLWLAEIQQQQMEAGMEVQEGEAMEVEHAARAAPSSQRGKAGKQAGRKR